MPANENNASTNEAPGQIAAPGNVEALRSIRAELTKLTGTPGSDSRLSHHTREHLAEISAWQGLERLLNFLESMQSTSGRSRQLRDFARLNEGTRAAASARTLADQNQLHS